jgi:hypothetical protein
MTTAAVRDLYDRLHDLEHTHGVTPQTLAICVLARAILALHDHAVDSGSTDRKLDLILVRLDALKAQGVEIMADVKELSDELDAIKAAVDASKVTAQEQIDLIKALQDQIAAGTPVSQAQLDELDAKADGILASLSPASSTSTSSKRSDR